ncbi:MAG TPA: pilus assembly protein [Hungateiclostridium thermocellum]|jgi:hypothetical protein|uniref:Pilus assembly protein n=4 Tax=Acetivibrio TaxID=35829 RepID=A3DGH2_ACET2|nr:TadE family protein [Acetivibrio thermocellus]ABN53051.1 hypothetical protein Cthe_1830 [Acetivibrio thermocellus ATCC 27405]ADU75515.1 hypothetical protein Clo1313_2506 [Acetivibrio thermocellus DSM 1313]ADU75528.1 hypothetical protein Clo1313_2523 [Acetivibrio thermocellus DSM 1313]ALX09518.1 hypothetical protein AD2_02534 [Acetivibrio thermocellus AD2]ANV77274.1 hypothetical protein LQRI_2533 [Acetivibrio thermocellus DSM 2360]
MNILKELLKKKDGSLTVEAAISLPLFMCVFLSIAFFMKVVYIHNNVQYAINGAANEVATYSYLYSISGLQKVNDAITETTDEYGTTASEHTKEILEAFDALGDISQQSLESFKGLAAGDTTQIDKLKELYEEGKISVGTVQKVIGEVKENPRKEFISVASLFFSAGYEKIKSELSEPLIKLFMRKYIDERIFNSKGGPGAYIVVKEGKDPLDAFSFNNRIFTDNKSIDIRVKYKIKTSLPINILPEISIEQRATVRGWMDGDKSAPVKEEPKEESLWDKAPFEYGKVITEKELEKYPDKYPNSGHIYEVRSINLDCETYKDIKKAKSSLKSSINKFSSKTKDVAEITSRTFIIVIPEGTLTDEIKAMLEELKSEAASGTPSIEVIYKEGYGRQSNVSDSSEEEK